MREILLVARREFVERGRDRTFLVTNLVILLLLIGSSVVPVLLGGEDPPFRVAAIGPEAQAVLTAADQQSESFGVDLEVREVADRGAAETALRDEELDAALDGPSTVLVREDLPADVQTLLASAGRGVAVESALADAGVPADQVPALTAAPDLDVQAVAGEEAGGIGVAAVVAFGAALLLYGLLLLLGQFIAQGIVEEKTSRVIEVLFSSIRPVQLLGGKVLGLGALGFIQLLVLAVVGVAAVVAGGIELPDGTLTALGLSLAWFVLGYAQYAALFATVGAVASRVEELQGSLLLAYMPVIAAFLAANSALGDPDGPVARVTGLLPFTAPMVQPIRAAAGVAPVWEPPLAIVISLATAIALIPVAARFYSGGALQVRHRIGFAAAWRPVG